MSKQQEQHKNQIKEESNQEEQLLPHKTTLKKYHTYQEPELNKRESLRKFCSRKFTLSSLPKSIIFQYNQFLFKKSNESIDKKLCNSVYQFKKLIYSDPVLKFNWQYGIAKSTITLPDKNGHDVIKMINVVLNQAPRFTNSPMIGCPINAIFLQFMQNQNGRNFFSNPQVNKALKPVLNQYHFMLQQPRSKQFLNQQSPDGWFSIEAKEQIKYDQYLCDQTKPHYGFRSWHQWFLRKFKPECRVLGSESPQHVHQDLIILNACQSTPLDQPKQPSLNVKYQQKFWLKDHEYSLVDMLSAKKHNKKHLAQLFEGGTVYQAFLSAKNYHRWHSPINGVVEDIYTVEGTYYLDKSQIIGYDQSSPQRSQPFLAAVATRLIMIIDSKNKKIGKIGIVFIGMAEVSSCVSTVKIGKQLKKGQQIGYFAFGGSSHVIIFEKTANLQFNQNLYGKTGVNGVTQKIFSYLAHVK